MRPILLALALVTVLTAEDCAPSSDSTQRDAQEKILAEATAQTGMPAVVNFQERKLMKEIIELRDQVGLVTYTYLWNEINGRLVFFCNSVGYGIPSATQYTNPEKVERWYGNGITLPQADPNALFSPASADATWVLCKDPNGPDTKPVYVEPRIVVSPFKLQ